MAQQQGGERGGPRLTMRLVGFQPGASQDKLVAALGRLYRGKDPEAIRRALANVPLTLTRCATEEQARKIRGFLEPRGAILEITYQGVLKASTPSGQAEQGAELAGVREPELPVQVSRPLTWARDRRSRPRVHQGLSLEPMSLKEILVRSVSLLQENLALFFSVLFIPNLVSFILARVVKGMVEGGMSQGSLLNVVLAGLVGVVIFLILFIWAEGALIHAVSEIHLGHETSLKGSYWAMRPKIGGLLCTMLLVWFLVMLGGLALVIPGLILIYRWLMADKVVVLEGLRGFQALARSRELMRFKVGPGLGGRPWVRVSVLAAGAGLVCLGIYLVFLIPGWLMSQFIPGAVTDLLAEGLELLAETLATAYGSIALVLYYYDIRVRKENFDHRSMAQHV